MSHIELLNPTDGEVYYDIVSALVRVSLRLFVYFDSLDERPEYFRCKLPNLDIPFGVLHELTDQLFPFLLFVKDSGHFGQLSLQGSLLLLITGRQRIVSVNGGPSGAPVFIQAADDIVQLRNPFLCAFLLLPLYLQFLLRLAFVRACS